MTFDKWMTRPVYVAHVKTWKRAAEMNLCGIGLFRALPGRRDLCVQTARNMVAVSMKMTRKARTAQS